MEEVKTIDAVTFNSLASKITNCHNLDELSEIGKELIAYEMNGYKKALITIYKTKRGEIIKDLLLNQSIFTDCYFLIKESQGNTLKRVGKILYHLKEKNVLSKGELNYLFEYYERKKNSLQNEINGTKDEEEIENELE